MGRTPRPVLPLGLLTDGMFLALRGQARPVAYLLQRIQDRHVGILGTACVLLAGVDVITVRVDDVPIAKADERRRRPVDVLAWPVCILTACELQQLRNRHS